MGKTLRPSQRRAGNRGGRSEAGGLRGRAAVGGKSPGPLAAAPETEGSSRLRKRAAQGSTIPHLSAPVSL